MPNFPPLSFDITTSGRGSADGDKLAVCVNLYAESIRNAAGVLIYLAMTYPTDEHLFDIKTGNIRTVNEDIRFDYIDTALELLQMAACGNGGETVIINTVLTPNEPRSFTAELIEGEWFLTLNLPEPIDGADGTDGREIELQKGTTHIQWRYVGETAWIDLVALTDIKGDTGEQGIQGIQGIQGEQGIQGIQGIQGEQGEQGVKGDTGDSGSGVGGDYHPDNDEPSTNTYGHICAVTNYVSDFIWARVSDYLSQAEANQANTEFVIDSVQAIIGLIPVLGSSVNWVGDAVQRMFSLNLVNVAADFNSTFKETVSCKLYCLLKASNSVNYSQSVHDAFMSYLHNLQGGSFFHAAMGPIVECVARADGYATLRQRGAIGLLKAPDNTCEALCTDCADDTVLITYNVAAGYTLGSGPSSVSVGDTFQISSGAFPPGYNSGENYHVAWPVFNHCVKLQIISSNNWLASAGGYGVMFYRGNCDTTTTQMDVSAYPNPESWPTDLQIANLQILSAQPFTVTMKILEITG